jgi:hypothetical protein
MGTLKRASSECPKLVWTIIRPNSLARRVNSRKYVATLIDLSRRVISNLQLGLLCNQNSLRSDTWTKAPQGSPYTPMWKQREYWTETSTYVIRSRNLLYEVLSNNRNFLPHISLCLPICHLSQHTTMISFRSLGTSEKKKIAKNPVTAPKPPRVNPLFSMSAHCS